MRKSFSRDRVSDRVFKVAMLVMAVTATTLSCTDVRKGYVSGDIAMSDVSVATPDTTTSEATIPDGSTSGDAVPGTCPDGQSPRPSGIGCEVSALKQSPVIIAQFVAAIRAMDLETVDTMMCGSMVDTTMNALLEDLGEDGRETFAILLESATLDNGMSTPKRRVYIIDFPSSEPPAPAHMDVRAEDGIVCVEVYS